MTIEAVLKLLQAAGGYGVAVLMYWFWKQADAERRRYRDMHEATLVEITKLPEALKGLTNEVARDNQRSLSTRPK